MVQRMYTRRVQKEINGSNQHRERTAATERTWRQVLTTNCHLSRFAMSISRQATSSELSTCNIQYLSYLL